MYATYAAAVNMSRAGGGEGRREEQGVFPDGFKVVNSIDFQAQTSHRV